MKSLLWALLAGGLGHLIGYLFRLYGMLADEKSRYIGDES